MPASTAAAIDAWSKAVGEPAFWVNVAIAVGTIGSVVIALVLALRAFRRESGRDAAEQQARLERQAELQAVLVTFDLDATQAMPGGPARVEVWVRNQSALGIAEVKAIDASGKVFGDGWGLAAGQSAVFYMEVPGGSVIPAVHVTFRDAYRRAWSVDDGGLTLLSGRTISAEPGAGDS